MKKPILSLLGCMIAFAGVQAQTFSDDFESYTAGIALGPQSADWRTWGGAGGGADDANVVTTDNHTMGGSKSIYFSSTSSTGGPQDVVLPFTASAPLSTGQFTFKTWFKIPAGKSSYFNFQGTSSMGAMYVLDCWMNTDGTIDIQNSGSPRASGTFPAGVWFELTIEANFNTNTWELLIDGVSQGTWSNSNNQVWGIDYYPADADASFWIDDVSYDVTPYTLPALNAAANGVGVDPGLVGGVRFPSVTVRNLGTGTINSFDVSISHNGGAPVSQSVSALTLASLATTTVDFTTSFTLATGANTFEAIISNVNGAGADGDSGDDTLTTVVNAVTPAAGKSVVAEEATGTWCGWCPRGAVFMDMMNERYAGAFVPIAVHNGDPMVVTEYDDNIGTMIGGYPSALVDRFPEIDPSGLEAEFLDRIVAAPKVFVVNGATWDAGSRELNVSITCTNQMAVSGSSKLICVLTEDGVTGTGSGYNQANYYAGGGSGPMGGYELLANPVPAASMVYDHVARFIAPGWDGITNAPGSSTGSGAAWTWNFTFTLPADMDENEVNIIGMFVDPSGEIDNASSATIAEAVANGFVNGTVASAPTAFDSPDKVVSLYPNPTNGAAQVALNLSQSAQVSMDVMNPQGALVATKSYGELSGNMILPVDLSPLAAGIYVVKVTVGAETTTLKLVKQ